MAIKREGYYYNGQLTRYINQFMSIFQGLHVQIGKWNDKDERLIIVPIHYANMDRVVAGVLTDNTQNKPLRLPIMSAYMSGMKIAMNRARGVGVNRREVFTPVGGLAPEDTRVIHQRMPVPHDLTMDLYIYTSNTDQHFQILEQILPLFDPSLNIQTSDSPFDWTRLTQVELDDISLDTNFPIGTDRRIIQSTLKFTMPIELDIPAEIRRDFIERIYMRIGAVSSDSVTNYEIIADLDGQQIPYDLIATNENIPFE